MKDTTRRHLRTWIITLVSTGVLGGSYYAYGEWKRMKNHVDVAERPGGLIDQYRATQQQNALDHAQLDRIEKKVDTMNQVFFFMLSAPSEKEQRAWFRDKAHELGLVAVPPPPPKN